MQKKLYFIPVIFFIGWVLLLSTRVMWAPTVVLPLRGYDPVSPLSGHYIVYRIDWDNVKCDIFPNGECPRHICKWGGDNCRFYIPEADSKDLDQNFRSYCGNKIKCEMEFAYIDENTLLPKKLLMDGKNWKEYLKSEKDNKK